MDGSLHLCHSALCTGLVGRVNESQWLAFRDGCAQSVHGAQAHAQVNGIASLANSFGGWGFRPRQVQVTLRLEF